MRVLQLIIRPDWYPNGAAGTPGDETTDYISDYDTYRPVGRRK